MNLPNQETDVLVEQRRRMAEVYRDGVPSDTEIDRARRRLDARARRRSHGGTPAPLRRVWALGLAQGFVAGLVTLAAASFVGAKVLPGLGVFWGPPAVEVRPPRETRREEPRPAPPAETRDAPRVEGESDPPRAVFPTASPAPAPSDVATPRTGGSRSARSPKPAVEPPALGQAPENVPPASPVAATTAVPPNTGAAWTHVAEALAAKDFDRAEAALKGLAENGDPATRDAASLSRAELWIARGSGAAVRQDVERLSREGRTRLIRRRAAELLRRIAP